MPSLLVEYLKLYELASTEADEAALALTMVAPMPLPVPFLLDLKQTELRPLMKLLMTQAPVSKRPPRTSPKMLPPKPKIPLPN